MEIAALQMNAGGFEKVERLTQGLKADLLILPEVFAIGWFPEKFKSDNGETVEFLSGLAKKLNTNIIGGSYIRDGYNTCPVLNRKGELVARYDKMHLFSVDGEEKYIKPGTNPVMVELEGLKIGLTICYDIRFPEIYRAYAKAGADLFVNVAAWGAHKPVQWDVMTRSRAAENQTYMVALTQCGGQNLGHSRIINYNGEIIAEITDEGLMCAEIDFDDVQKFSTLNDIKENYEVIYEKSS
jgi:predicted amidohydrolase